MGLKPPGPEPAKERQQVAAQGIDAVHGGHMDKLFGLCAISGQSCCLPAQWGSDQR